MHELKILMATNDLRIVRTLRIETCPAGKRGWTIAILLLLVPMSIAVSLSVSCVSTGEG